MAPGIQIEALSIFGCLDHPKQHTMSSDKERTLTLSCAEKAGMKESFEVDIFSEPKVAAVFLGSNLRGGIKYRLYSTTLQKFN
jgi:hypothetical protein